MSQKNNKLDPRKYMELAIQEMYKSISEHSDRNDPKVGAVLVSQNGELLGTAFRGELRLGDHAEFTLIERKFVNEDLSGCKIFATLEPCFHRNPPKSGCSKRIVRARISEVWIGIEDPDPKADRKGIQYMMDHGIKVHMFDRDLQQEIEKANIQFIKEARQRAKIKKDDEEKALTPFDNPEINANLEMFSKEALNLYLVRSKSQLSVDSKEFQQELYQLGLLENKDDGLVPTGYGILLFGEKPRNLYPQASVKAKVDYGDGSMDVESFDDSLVLMPEKIESWLKKVLPESIDRSSFVKERKNIYPIEVIREAVINAIVHRDYTKSEAKIQLNITPEKIEISSPGLPIEPITINDLKAFRAPSLSRNPKITYIFNEMEYVEEAGIGMDTYRSLREKYNLPLPIITYKDPYVSVVFPRTVEAISKIGDNEIMSALNTKELEGLDFIRQNGTVSKKEYANHFGINEKTAQRHLSKMRELGIVITNGENEKSPNLRYLINDNI